MKRRRREGTAVREVNLRHAKSERGRATRNKWAKTMRDRWSEVYRGYQAMDRDAWNEVMGFYGGKCAYCEERPAQEREHMIPTAKGGPTEIFNIVPSCRQCNARKQTSIAVPRRRHRWMKDPAFYFGWTAPEGQGAGR